MFGLEAEGLCEHRGAVELAAQQELLAGIGGLQFVMSQGEEETETEYECPSAGA